MCRWMDAGKALFGEKEWYFFSPRDRKYPNGSRPNRVAESGYWKATGTDKIITTEGKRVGIKKALVFYVGKAPKGTKTNWIMHEYRLIESFRKTGSSKLDDWVLCRIYKKNAGSFKPALSSNSSKEHSLGNSSSSSSLDDMLETFSEIDDRLFSLPRMNSLKTLQYQQQQLQLVEEEQKPNFQNTSSVGFSWAGLSGLDVGPSSRAVQNQELATNVQNDAYYLGIAPPSNPTMAGTEEEVQSGLRTGGGYIQMPRNTIGLAQSPNHPLDLYGCGYGYGFPAQTSGFGFRQ